LRLLDGFAEDELAAFAGPQAACALQPCFDGLVVAGVLDRGRQRIRLSERGLQLHSEVVVRCLMALEEALGPAGKELALGWPVALPVDDS
jgi:hypothetical protein